MSDTFDYIVVGAGSAGAVVAARLTEDPDVSVLLLEAGPRDNHRMVHIPAGFPKVFRTERDWDYWTEEQPGLGNRRVFWPRGKMLGGCSSINAMMWVRGFAADYEAWGNKAGSGWGFDSVRGYFERIENVETGGGNGHGVGGPQAVSTQRSMSGLTSAFLNAVVEAGYSIDSRANLDEPQGFSATEVSQRRGLRASTAVGYLKPASRRPNLTVRTGAQASKVVITDGRATSVQYRVGDINRTAYARREIILSGGAINTPQLLMLSGVGPAAQLREHGIDVVVDSAEVGQNLLDHLTVAYVVGSTGIESLFSATHPKHLLNLLTQRRGMLTSNVGEAYGFIRSNPALTLPDLELLFGPGPFVGQGLIDAPGHGMALAPILLQPKSVGEITLASGNPYDAMRIDPRYLSDPGGEDRTAMMEGLRICDVLLATKALGQHFTGEYLQPAGAAADERLDMALEQASQTIYHPVGTCRMGEDAASVVDPELKVRGVQALRVADASVMPTIIRGHTNAPSIVVGERAADLIRGK